MYYNNENTSQAFALSSPLRLALVRGENVPGSTEIGNSNMKHHHPSWAPAKDLPKGKMNPSKAREPIENPTQ